VVAKSEWTVVLFEAPPRVAELLEDLAAACGAERPAAVARELTKLFEETAPGPWPSSRVTTPRRRPAAK